jgi:hypothetical protein
MHLSVLLYALRLILRHDLNYLLCAAQKGHNVAFLYPELCRVSVLLIVRHFKDSST